MFDFNDVLPSFKLCNHLLHEYYLLTAEMATSYLLSLHITRIILLVFTSLLKLLPTGFLVVVLRGGGFGYLFLSSAYSPRALPKPLVSILTKCPFKNTIHENN